MRINYFNKKIECETRKNIEMLQLERLKYIVAKLFEKVPFYSELLKRHRIKPSDIKKLSDISKLPFTTKDDLRKNFPYKLFAEPLKKVVRVHASSGTTGIPTVVGYTKNDLKTWSNLTARVLTAGGLTNKDIAQISFGYGLFTGAFGMHYGAERVGATVIPISSGNTARQVDIIKNFGTTALICTPSYALQILDASKQLGVDIKKTSLKLGFFGAEPWSESMRQEIEREMNIIATDNYGLSEIIGPGFAGECLYKCGLHIAEDHFIAEIINPDTGEVLPYGESGELVITTLTKEALPILRYRTRDLTTLNPEPCQCGRTHLRMQKVKGRSDDMLIIKGVNVFPSQIEDVLLKIKGLLPFYQIELTTKNRLDEIAVHVEVREDLLNSNEKKNALLKEISMRLLAVLSLSPKIHLHKHNTLERTIGKAIRVIDNRKKR